MHLRVMTYNILDGGENQEPYILNVIQAAKPDVVILQEVFTKDFLKFLSQPLGMAYFIGTKSEKLHCLVNSPFSHVEAIIQYFRFGEISLMLKLNIRQTEG